MPSPFSVSRISRAAHALILFIGLALSGCAMRLISDYDESTDKAVTALQKKTETHLIALEAENGKPPACRYENHRRFYDEAKADLSSITVRAAALPRNGRTNEQLDSLGHSLDDLEKLHRIGCLSQEQIRPLRIQFNTLYTAILKLELAKQRGE